MVILLIKYIKKENALFVPNQMQRCVASNARCIFSNATCILELATCCWEKCNVLFGISNVLFCRNKTVSFDSNQPRCLQESAHGSSFFY